MTQPEIDDQNMTMNNQTVYLDNNQTAFMDGSTTNLHARRNNNQSNLRNLVDHEFNDGDFIRGDDLNPYEDDLIIN